MKSLEQFKNENHDWLVMMIEEYANEMKWDEGMNSHPGDYFTDTFYISREKCQDEELAILVKEYIEKEVIIRLK
jgi:hypothetical protein